MYNWMLRLLSPLPPTVFLSVAPRLWEMNPEPFRQETGVFMGILPQREDLRHCHRSFSEEIALRSSCGEASLCDPELPVIFESPALTHAKTQRVSDT